MEIELLFKPIRVFYRYHFFGGMVQVGSRLLESVPCPGVYMRQTTWVVSFVFSTIELTRRSQWRVR